MEKRLRIALKLILIFVCAICFLLLMKRDTRVFRIKQPKGEGIAVEDVMILMQAFGEKAVLSGETGNRFAVWIEDMDRRYQGGGEEKFLYKDYIEMVKLLSNDKKYDLKDRYNDDFYLLKNDWYENYDMLIEEYGLSEKIKLAEISVLSCETELVREGSLEAVDGYYLLTEKGELCQYLSDAFREQAFSVIKAYVCEDILLTVREQKKDEFTMDNVWIMEADESGFQFFFKGFEVVCRIKQSENGKALTRESVADITFSKGKIKKVKTKDERISGRLLRLSEEELELQDKGTYQISENCRVYQLYEELLETDLTRLRIGYDFSDYVLEDGKICAVLIMRKENMESIRVAVMNSGFQSVYHDLIELLPDCDMELVYGPYENRERKLIPKGEELLIDRESKYLDGDRVELIPSVQSGKIKLLSVERSQGKPEYRGKMEIVNTPEGLVLINELLLEEYLYSVVPSEMPALYPKEALKAQAVCARTYAYRYLIHPGMPQIGAHVDDSVNYQVYNNIAENLNSTRAVKETTGTLLYYGDEAVSTYYYSTSCGFGTDAGVWGENNKEEIPYLSSVHIEKKETGSVTPGEMAEEESFREYITAVHEEDYEKEEPWYRWEYEVKKIDAEKMAERLSESFTEIYDIYIEERREGGTAQKLVLETDEGTIEVTGEYNIRYSLNNGGSVRKQDGTTAETGKILPSAYFVIDVVKDEENVVGYTILGGGYGHGVGMSQNGARSMANESMDCEAILTFFYPDCHMKKIY